MDELLPHSEMYPGPSQYFQVTEWMASINGKEEHDYFNRKIEGKPPPPKPLPIPSPVASRSNANMIKQPQAQKKGKGNAPDLYIVDVKL
ncbi:hypothetical protein O181_003387 [Austropuccinia psidii MF-1]|uniref:Uncharacterized protein n=1 Tax=Austropuccinia psidii MF-1 TaxID=1389203 RepID=A0A9Q3BEA6_9BASI|nr:hypothetical protein [Austropuccinia psidii MF-1]